MRSMIDITNQAKNYNSERERERAREGGREKIGERRIKKYRIKFNAIT